MAILEAEPVAEKSVRCLLSDCQCGDEGVVALIELDPEDAALLAAMGLDVGVRVRLCRIGDPFIVAVGRASGLGGYRIGLARRLAERIHVSGRRPGA